MNFHSIGDPTPEDLEAMAVMLDRLKNPPFDEAKKWHPGDVIRVKSGPFEGLAGQINSVNLERCTVSASLMVFGRETPVHLHVLDIEAQPEGSVHNAISGCKE